jgi:hypothetical protein
VPPCSGLVSYTLKMETANYIESHRKRQQFSIIAMRTPKSHTKNTFVRAPLDPCFGLFCRYLTTLPATRLHNIEWMDKLMTNWRGSGRNRSIHN